jgi:hypothetical protein
MSTNYVPSNADSSFSNPINNEIMNQNNIFDVSNSQISVKDDINNTANANAIVDYYIRKNIGWRRKSTNLHKFYPNS